MKGVAVRGLVLRLWRFGRRARPSGANGTSAMLIDEQFPQAVGGRATLREAFVAEAMSAGTSPPDAERLFAALPARLAQAECFMDRVTDLWRYEFGRPWTLGRGALLGPHVWQPVRHLVSATRCAVRLLQPPALARWMARLDDDSHHEEVLVELLPAPRFPNGVGAEFEFRTGVGNRDVDWRLTTPGERPLLFDVKRRIKDLLALAERTMAGERRENGTAPQPAHDAGLLFRSVEKKYAKVDPDVQLQGAWIVTGLKQEATDLRRAFDALDHRRVHFAVLGGWSGGVGLLTRRVSDRSLVLGRLGLNEVPGAFEFLREPES